MKKRTAFIGAILSLIPFGQPLLIKNSVGLSTQFLIISLSENLYASDAFFYFNRAIKKEDDGDYYGAISDCNKAIQINPKDSQAFINRAVTKFLIGDKKGACFDARKGKSLGSSKGSRAVELICK